MEIISVLVRIIMYLVDLYPNENYKQQKQKLKSSYGDFLGVGLIIGLHTFFVHIGNFRYK